MKTNSIFNTVATNKVRRNTFDLSYDNKLTFRMGELVPTCVIETIPGDAITIKVENLLRFAPLVSPVMHRVFVTTDFFEVGNHVTFPEFDKFITGKTTPAHPVIKVDSSDITAGTLGDYLGYKSANFADWEQNAFPAAAYFKIYDDWYRSDKIQTTELYNELVAGDNSTNYQTLIAGQPLKRAWAHDYFTAALPTAAGTDVQIPIVAEATVELDATQLGVPQKVRYASDHTLNSASQILSSQLTTGDLEASSGDMVIDPNGTLYAQVVAEDITTLRRATALQRFLEASNRGGQRITEWLQTIWGVKSSDSRHDRPIFIGRTVQPMKISEVLSTAEGASTEVGTFAGHGISVGGGKFKHYCEDHGWIIGITSVMPESSYQQGLHKSMKKSDYLDYPIPHFANIGEEEILNSELYIGTETETTLDGVFGYIPRYASYKYKHGEVHGDFRSDSAQTLEHFHLAREFATKPSLNGDFLECDPSARIFADTSETTDQIWAHVFNNIKASRKLPKFNVPQL